MASIRHWGCVVGLLLLAGCGAGDNEGDDVPSGGPSPQLGPDSDLKPTRAISKGWNLERKEELLQRSGPFVGSDAEVTPPAAFTTIPGGEWSTPRNPQSGRDGGRLPRHPLVADPARR